MSNRGLNNEDNNLSVSLNDNINSYINLKKSDNNLIINIPVISSFTGYFTLYAIYNHKSRFDGYQTYGRGIKLSIYY